MPLFLRFDIVLVWRSLCHVDLVSKWGIVIAIALNASRYSIYWLCAAWLALLVFLFKKAVWYSEKKTTKVEEWLWFREKMLLVQNNAKNRMCKMLNSLQFSAWLPHKNNYKKKLQKATFIVSIPPATMHISNVIFNFMLHIFTIVT